MPPKLKYDALKKKWYDKLRQSGFKDLEDADNNWKSWTGSTGLAHLDTYAKITTNRKDYSSLVYKQSQAEYYRRACQILHEKEFPSKKAKAIWDLHAQGCTYKQIAETLGQGLTASLAAYHVGRIRKLLMGL